MLNNKSPESDKLPTHKNIRDVIKESTKSTPIVNETVAAAETVWEVARKRET